MTAAETSELESRETLALLTIEKHFTDSPGVWGIILEVICGAAGVKFYRKEFLLELRKLCSSYKKYLIVDEVLTGLRTGKMFAFLHYQDFQPDFIVIGKAFGVAAVIACGEFLIQSLSKNISDTTIAVDHSMLFRSLQILKRIHSDSLLEQSKETGKAFLDLLRKKDTLIANQNENRSRGIGSLLFSKADHLVPFRGSFYRYLPPITLTINRLLYLSKLDTGKINVQDFCYICEQGGLLIICEHEMCNKAAHLACIGLKREPQNFVCDSHKL